MTVSWKVKIPWPLGSEVCPFPALAGCNTAKDPSPEGFQVSPWEKEELFDHEKWILYFGDFSIICIYVYIEHIYKYIYINSAIHSLDAGMISNLKMSMTSQHSKLLRRNFHRLHPFIPSSFMTDVSSPLTTSPTQTPWFIPFTEALKRHATSPKAYISWPKGKKHSRTSWPKIREAGGASSMDFMVATWCQAQKTEGSFLHTNDTMLAKSTTSHMEKKKNCECNICCPSVRIDVHTHRDRFAPRCDTCSPEANSE